MQRLDDKCLLNLTGMKWYTNIHSRNFPTTKDAAQSESPSKVSTFEFVAYVHDLILVDYQVSVKTIAKRLETSKRNASLSL